MAIKRPGIKTNIIQDKVNRTGATTQQTDDIVQTIAITRPKSPADRNLELLEELDRRRLDIPRVAGNDLTSINTQIETALKDPVYAQNQLIPQAAQPTRQPGIFDKTIGRVVGAGGRAILGAGRAVGESLEEQFGDAFSELGEQTGEVGALAAGELQEQPIVQAADVLGRTGGALLAEDIAPVASVLERGVKLGIAGTDEEKASAILDRTSFESYLATLEERRIEADLLQQLLLEPNRKAFDETEFPPGVKLGLEVLGDPLNLLLPTGLPLLGVGKSAVANLSDEAIDAAFKAARNSPELTDDIVGELLSKATGETAEAALETEVKATRTGLAAQRPAATKIKEAAVGIGKTTARVTADELGQALDAARKIITSPLHPKESAKGFAAWVNNEQVILSGDKSTDKLIQSLVHAEVATEKSGRLLHKQRQNIVAKIRKFRQEANEAGDAGDFDLAQRKMSAARKGETPTPDFEIPEHLQMSGDEIFDMRQRISSSHLSDLEAARGDFAFVDLMMRGKLIPKGEIENLTEVFGPGFRNAMNKFRSKPQKLGQAMRDVVGSPISFVSSYDLSAPFRQGYFLMSRMPANGVRTMGDMTRAFFDPAFAEEIDTGIRTSPNYRRFKRAGLFMSDPPAGAKGSAGSSADEVFISSLPSRIPIFGLGIRASQRAYSTFLNKMRMDYMEGVYKGWQQPIPIDGKLTKPVITDKSLKQLAQLANFATGRGPGLGVQALNDIASVSFFAPRLATSRFALPAVSASQMAGIVKASPQMRKESARMLAQGFGTMLGVAGGLATGSNMQKKKTGKAPFEVELDPRSSDFAKIKVGSSRIDMNAGFQQIFRMMAQVASGQRKTTGTGAKLSQEETTTIGRFLRSKFSPVAGLAADLVTGETFIGEELEATPSGVGNIIWERLAPLYWQDVVEAMQIEGIMKGGLVSLPGMVGGGVTTFQNSRDVANNYLKDDIIMTDDEGNRIFDIQDENMTPAQKSQLFNDRRVQSDLEEINKKTREDYLLSSSQFRERKQIARDEELARGTLPATDWRSQRTTQGIVEAEVAKVREIFEGEFRNGKNFEGVAGYVLDIFNKNEIDRSSGEQSLLEWYEIFDRHIIDPTVFDSIDFDPKNATDQELEVIGRGIDLDGLQDERDRFLADLSESDLNFVLENTNPDRTGVEDVYLRGQRTLREYWDVPKEVARNDRELALYDEFRSLPPNAQRQFEINNPSVIRMRRLVENKRRIMRIKNQEIDELLVTFYDFVPQNPKLLKESRGGLNANVIKQRVLAGADPQLDQSLNLIGVER